MKTQRQTHRVSLLAAAFAAACVGCTQPKETTAIGSATGGAIGAGLGAIVGNQTGSTGGGIAIGAVAGAATGALIGNALQAQQETAQKQDEALERQDRLIRAQRQELNELRTIQPDTAVPSAAPSRSSYQRRQHQTLSPEAQRKLAQLERRGPNPTGEHSSAVAYVPPPLKSNSEPLARYNAESTASHSRPQSKPAAPSAGTTASLAKPKAAPAQPKQKEEQELAAESATSSSSIGETDILEEPATAEGAASLAEEPTTTSTACSEAGSEAQAAQAAVETSQKLYHLRRAQRLCPTNGTFHVDLGNVYLAMGRPSDARNEFNDALKLDPSLKAARDGLEEVKSAGPEKF